jgi:hypothetical protein
MLRGSFQVLEREEKCGEWLTDSEYLDMVAELISSRELLHKRRCTDDDSNQITSKGDPRRTARTSAGWVGRETGT